MKWIKLFDSFEQESEWSKEQRQIKDDKKRTLMQYSINGSKVIFTEGFEDIGCGFGLENGDIFIVNYSSPRIALHRYDEINYQYVNSDYSYNSAYNNWKEGNFTPLFNTKQDAQTFVYLFNELHIS